MNRYEVTYCILDENGKNKIICTAVTAAETTAEAEKITFSLLKPKYPEINKTECTSIIDPRGFLPEEPAEIPCASGSGLL